MWQATKYDGGPTTGDITKIAARAEDYIDREVRRGVLNLVRSLGHISRRSLGLWFVVQSESWCQDVLVCFVGDVLSNTLQLGPD